MSAIPYGPDREETWEDEPQQPPPRSNPVARAGASSTAGARHCSRCWPAAPGFYGGVRVEKSQKPPATSSSAVPRSFSPPTAGWIHHAVLERRRTRQRYHRDSLQLA